MSEFLNSTPIWLLIIYGIVFLFSAFFPGAFIYSMLFGWLHESKRTKNLIVREQRVAGIAGGGKASALCSSQESR